jgi:hypothetical protein
MSTGGSSFATPTKKYAPYLAKIANPLMHFAKEEDQLLFSDPLNLTGVNSPAAEPALGAPTTPTPAAQATAAEEAAAQARRDFLAKQALLNSKNSTIKTNSLGSASDTLQTGKKTLLGG